MENCLFVNARSQLQNVYRYGRQATSWDMLKFIAIIGVLIDHIGFFFFPKVLLFRVIGRIAAPIFFFLIGFTGAYPFRWGLFLGGVFLSLLFAFYMGYIYLPGASLSHNIWVTLFSPWQFSDFDADILLYFVALRALFYIFKPEQWRTLFLIALLIVSLIESKTLSILLEYSLLGLDFAVAGRLLATEDERYLPWLASSVIIYFFRMNMSFLKEFNLMSVVLFAVMIILFFLLYNYKKRTIILPRFSLVPVLLVSRYTFQIYIGQYVVFIALKIMIVQGMLGF